MKIGEEKYKTSKKISDWKSEKRVGCSLLWDKTSVTSYTC